MGSIIRKNLTEHPLWSIRDHRRGSLQAQARNLIITQRASATTHAAYAESNLQQYIREGCHVAPVGRQCSCKVFVLKVNAPAAGVAVVGRSRTNLDATTNAHATQAKAQKTDNPSGFQTHVRDGGGAEASHPRPHSSWGVTGVHAGVGMVVPSPGDARPSSSVGGSVQAHKPLPLAGAHHRVSARQGEEQYHACQCGKGKQHCRARKGLRRVAGGEVLPYTCAMRGRVTALAAAVGTGRCVANTAPQCGAPLKVGRRSHPPAAGVKHSAVARKGW